MQSDAYSPTDLLTAENPSNWPLRTVLLKPLYNITHFYLISLSPDWPYRSTLTIPCCSMQSDSYSPTDQSTTKNPSIPPLSTMLLKPLYIITHFYLISLSPDWPYTVNIDHTICSMQSDSYSPTDQSNTENPSNRHSVLCYSSHSTLLRTSTSSHYLPTGHIGQHWPYHMLHAARRIFPDRPFNPPKTHQTVTHYYATQATLQHHALLLHLTISRLTISVNIDHTICCMLSDAYSPTDHLTTENPSNRHSLLCYSSHSTT